MISIRKVVILLLLGFFCNSCIQTYQLAKRMDNDLNCTSLHGLLLTKPRWYKKVPAIVIKEDYELKTLFGNIVQISDSSITFDPNSEGAFYDPPPKVFSKKDVVCLIDKNHQVIYGSVPQKINLISYGLVLELVDINNLSNKPIRIVLDTNIVSSYCIPPGDYKITKLFFLGYNARVADECIDSLNMNISIKENVANMLGIIKSDLPFSDSTNVHFFNTKKTLNLPLYTIDSKTGWYSAGNLLIDHLINKATAPQILTNEEVGYYSGKTIHHIVFTSDTSYSIDVSHKVLMPIRNE